jgi:hypothetical protein
MSRAGRRRLDEAESGHADERPTGGHEEVTT